MATAAVTHPGPLASAVVGAGAPGPPRHPFAAAGVRPDRMLQNYFAQSYCASHSL